MASPLPLLSAGKLLSGGWLRLRPPCPALHPPSCPPPPPGLLTSPQPPSTETHQLRLSQCFTSVAFGLSLQRAVDVHFWEAAILGGCGDPCFLPLPSRSTLLAPTSDWPAPTNRASRTISRPRIGRKPPAWPRQPRQPAGSLQLIIFNGGFASQFLRSAASSWL